MTETKSTGVPGDGQAQLISGPAPPRLAVSRWTRAGQDRLYVNGPDGEAVGYRDLTTGADHATSVLHLAVVGTVADAWCHDHRRQRSTPRASVPLDQAPPAPVVPSAVAAAASAPTRAWADLSRNVAGAAVRAKAAEVAQAGRDDPSPRRLGADGEEHVGRVLAEVTRAHAAWQAIHAVPVGTRGSDIDHVVMGPGGVFTLNTKHHAGSTVYVNRDGYLVNGSRTPNVRNARHEAERAARFLSEATGIRLHVTGVIVPVGARSLRVRNPPDGVFVVPAQDLHGWLRSTGDILPVEVLAKVWEASRRSTTWQG